MKPIKNIVIAGGGTSGWLAAAALSKLLGKNISVTIIESEAIGRIGVGEATIPPLRNFHKLLGIHEQEFMKTVQATFKLGIEFKNWGKKDDRYFHSFGATGKDCWACDFQHFWLGGLKKGFNEDFGSYCIELQAALAHKILGSENSGVNYAYHLDAGLYAEFLKDFSIKHGAKHVVETIEEVLICEHSGHIKSLKLSNESFIEGDLFIDCTGFSARLIEGALNTGYESYQRYLPCDSAVAVQSKNCGEPPPYTQSIAHDSGWQWRIPLQHRTGNGFVYCSRYIDHDDAKTLLMNNLASDALTEPRMFSYHTGRRLKAWNKNCIALGLASGFLEPLESTSIHLAMSGLLKLLRFFPKDGIQPSSVDEYNRQMQDEFEKIRDFLVVHYHVTERDDSPFWRYCQSMDIPEDLSHRLKLFKQTASIPLKLHELFKVDSWTQVLFGQRMMPEQYHPIVDLMSDQEMGSFFTSIKTKVDQAVEQMPTHQQFIDRYCKAKPM